MGAEKMNDFFGRVARILTLGRIPMALLLSSSVVIGIASGLGKLLAFALPFSLFECTLLSLLTLLAISGCFVLAAICGASLWRTQRDDDDTDWSEAPDANEEDAHHMEHIMLEYVRSNAVMLASANAKCPCGSGKKHKRCHGAAKKSSSPKFAV
jgi:hypothetical protein